MSFWHLKAEVQYEVLFVSVHRRHEFILQIVDCFLGFCHCLLQRKTVGILPSAHLKALRVATQTWQMKKKVARCFQKLTTFTVVSFRLN